MTKNVRKRTQRIFFALIAFTQNRALAVALTAFLTGLIAAVCIASSASESLIISFLLILPVSLMATSFGWKGGMFYALLAIGVFLTLVMVYGSNEPVGSYVVPPVIILIFAALLGAYSGREAELRGQLRREYMKRRDAFNEFTAIIAPPKRFLRGPWKVLWHYQPTQEIIQALGGDFLDYKEVSDGTLYFVLGDVSGHGPDSAALGASLRLVWSVLIPERMDGLDNLMLIMQDVFHAQRRGDIRFFATACLGRLWPEGRLELLCAGHEPPLLVGSHGARQAEVSSGPGIGILEKPQWHVSELYLKPSEWLILFTDGLTEATLEGKDGVRLGIEGLAERLEKTLSITNPDFKKLCAALRTEHGGPLDDDAAILAVHRLS